MKNYEVKFRDDEFNVEWGLQWFDKEETFMYYVADNTDMVYVSSKQEAQKICDTLIRWKLEKEEKNNDY